MERTAPWRSRARLAACCAAALIGGAPLAARAAGLADAAERPALATPRANGAVLLGIARAGARAVAVGERGVVLLSDDEGSTWRQASVPVSITLTAVQFADARHGWAVGHAGTVLATQDGGEHWVRQLDGETAARLARDAAPAAAGMAASAALRNAERLVAEGADKPWLDLHFRDTRRGLVVGAYGLAFATEDGGATWQPWLDRLDNPKGLHLNAIAVRGEQIVIAGEQGLLLRSSDGGAHFGRLASPYDGSWFAAGFLPGGRLLLAGLRGNVYRSDDGGASFERCDIAAPVTVTGLALLRDGGVLALNQAGQALLSRDQGRSLQAIALPPGAPLTAVAELGSGRLVAASLRGARDLPSLKGLP